MNTIADFWLKFNPNGLRFVGKAPKKYFYTSILVKVVATDGYTEFSDSFTMKIHDIPFMLLI